MFLRRIFSKVLWDSGSASLLRFDGISLGSLKIYSQSYENNLTDLPPHDYAQVLSFLFTQLLYEN